MPKTPFTGFLIPMIRRLVLLPLCIAALSACDKGGSYNDGYEAGKAEAAAQYERGLKEGFERARPGTNSKLSGAALEIYRLAVIGGALKLALSLLVACGILTFKEGEPVEHTIGKVLSAVIGVVIGLSIIFFASPTGWLLDIFLRPAPAQWQIQIVVFFIAGVTALILLSLLRDFIWIQNVVYLDASLIAFLTALLTILAPLMKTFLNDVPDASKYLVRQHVKDDT
jgi:hypothetical protein